LTPCARATLHLSSCAAESGSDSLPSPPRRRAALALVACAGDGIAVRPLRRPRVRLLTRTWRSDLGALRPSGRRIGPCRRGSQRGGRAPGIFVRRRQPRFHDRGRGPRAAGAGRIEADWRTISGADRRPHDAPARASSPSSRRGRQRGSSARPRSCSSSTHGFSGSAALAPYDKTAADGRAGSGRRRPTPPRRRRAPTARRGMKGLSSRDPRLGARRRSCRSSRRRLGGWPEAQIQAFVAADLRGDAEARAVVSWSFDYDLPHPPGHERTGLAVTTARRFGETLRGGRRRAARLRRSRARGGRRPGAALAGRRGRSAGDGTPELDRAGPPAALRRHDSPFYGGASASTRPGGRSRGHVFPMSLFPDDPRRARPRCGRALVERAPLEDLSRRTDRPLDHRFAAARATGGPPAEPAGTGSTKPEPHEFGNDVPVMPGIWIAGAARGTSSGPGAARSPGARQTRTTKSATSLGRAPSAEVGMRLDRPACLRGGAYRSQRPLQVEP